MSEPEPTEGEVPADAGVRGRRWDAMGVIVASLVGLLALLVSGYTAYIQRQQVRAQVWPYLTKAYVDPADTSDTLRKLAIFNKGVGPAIVRSVQVSVDGKSQTTWQQVFSALNLSSVHFGYSSLAGNVLSPGETLDVLIFKDAPAYSRFRDAMSARARMSICYCSTLGECWMLADHSPRGEPEVQPITECPRLSSADAFRN
jgi:hypothetical protein